MKGINWNLTVSLLALSAVAFAVIDVFSGAYSKDKLIAAGWTPK